MLGFLKDGAARKRWKNNFNFLFGRSQFIQPKDKKIHNTHHYNQKEKQLPKGLM